MDPQMQCDNPRAKGWGRLIKCNGIEKPLESNKKRIKVSRQPCIHKKFQMHPKQIKRKIKDDVKKKWSYNLLKIFS
jgi:hypothetical protein